MQVLIAHGGNEWEGLGHDILLRGAREYAHVWDTWKISLLIFGH